MFVHVPRHVRLARQPSSRGAPTEARDGRVKEPDVGRAEIDLPRTYQGMFGKLVMSPGYSGDDAQELQTTPTGGAAPRESGS